METDNKNVNPNQKPEPQKEEKKKNKIVAWWLGLKKQWKIVACAGSAVVLSGAVVGIVFGVKGCQGGKTNLNSISLGKSGVFLHNVGDEDFATIVTNPENVDISKATIQISNFPADKFQYTFDGANKKINIKNNSCSESFTVDCTVTLTLNGKTFTAEHNLNITTSE